MTDNKYVIRMTDDYYFDLYTNGILTVTEEFIGNLLITIAGREEVNVQTQYVSESYILAVLREAGVMVDLEPW